jgi:hypothetical protein
VDRLSCAIAIAVLLTGPAAASPGAELSGQPPLPAGTPVDFDAPLGNDYVILGAPASNTFAPVSAGVDFSIHHPIPGLAYVGGADVDDLDGDGDNDFVVCDAPQVGPNVVYSYVNDGRGHYSVHELAQFDNDFGQICTYLRIADFNGDGTLDFVVGDPELDHGIQVYLLLDPGAVGLVVPLDTSWQGEDDTTFVVGVAAGDLDGDALADVALLDEFPAAVYLYPGDGLGGFGSPNLVIDLETDFGVVNADGLARIDVEGDGDLDLVVGGAEDGAHYVYTNDGAGNFSAPAGPAFDVDNFTQLDDWDADGDGDTDLLIARFPDGTLLYSENVGGTLQSPVPRTSMGPLGYGIGAPRTPFPPPIATPAVSRTGVALLAVGLLAGSTALLAARRRKRC